MRVPLGVRVRMGYLGLVEFGGLIGGSRGDGLLVGGGLVGESRSRRFYRGIHKGMPCFMHELIYPICF
jgi:hypothetical protein